MKTVAYLQGSCTWYIPYDAVMPEYGLAMPQFSAFLQNAFGFETVDYSTEGRTVGLPYPVAFNGQVNLPEGVIPVFSLEFSADKIVLTSSKSEMAEQALSAIMDSLVENLSFQESKDFDTREYNSSIVVDTGIDISDIFATWAPIMNLFSIGPTKAIQSLRPLGIRFLGSSETTGGMYVLERRIPSPEGANWWFSQGPFSTANNEMVVETIVDLFSPKLIAKSEIE